MPYEVLAARMLWAAIYSEVLDLPRAVVPNQRIRNNPAIVEEMRKIIKGSYPFN